MAGKKKTELDRSGVELALRGRARIGQTPHKARGENQGIDFAAEKTLASPQQKGGPAGRGESELSERLEQAKIEFVTMAKRVARELADRTAASAEARAAMHALAESQDLAEGFADVASRIKGHGGRPRGSTISDDDPVLALIEHRPKWADQDRKIWPRNRAYEWAEQTYGDLVGRISLAHLKHPRGDSVLYFKMFQLASENPASLPKDFFLPLRMKPHRPAKVRDEASARSQIAKTRS